MFWRITWSLAILITILTVTDGKYSSISVSGEKFSIYRVKTHNPFSRLKHVESHTPENIEELILSLPHEVLFTNFDGNWRRDVIPVENNERRYKNVCNLNNGNCSQICEDVDGQAVCSCQLGFSVTEKGDCVEATRKETVLSGTSGNFIANKKDYSWIIKAPEHHLIRCVITVQLPEKSYLSPDKMFNYVEVHDGHSQSGRLYGDTITAAKRRWTSSGQYLHIRIHHFHESGLSFNISYETGAPSNVLTSKYGTIRIERKLTKVCYSLTYSLSVNGRLNVVLYDRYGNSHRRSLQSSFKAVDERWFTEIFQLDLDEYGALLQFNGVDSKVYSFRKCTDIEQHWAGNPVAYENGLAAGGLISVGDRTKCHNGGTWDTESEKCFCPVGFIGPSCEEGCGPNRYGENCTAVCSAFSRNCEGMIFCTEDNCSCAPGFHGINCDTPCEEGWYGTSCQQWCGKCTDDNPCDIYTGKCFSGCENGFYPPLCQQTYKMLRDKPVITEIGYTYVIVDLSFENVVGAGEPTFYEVQYKVVGDQSWSKRSPRLLSNKGKFNISGLLAGKKYEVRVILIDKDGGSYQTDVPKATVVTKCIEPEKENYNFGAQNVSVNDIILEWSYAPKENSLECEVKEFELLFYAGNDEFFVPVADLEGIERIHDLLPDTDYSFQLTGKTVTGKKLVPSKIIVHTLSAAPGKVRDVEVTASSILNNIIISWSPPWNYAERPLRYEVTYECEKLLACNNVSCASFSGHIEVQKNVATLENIKPHAVYQIKIVAIAPENVIGEELSISATSSYSAPQVTPSAAENPILSITNVSASVKWMPPTDCTKLNGYLYGYSYTLVDTETSHTLYQGTVPENTLHASFSDLEPRRCYEMYVAIVSSGVTEFRDFLVIPFCTKSTAPDPVRSLEVYKRGRKMVGLRWSLPLNTYGDIESFTVTYGKVGKDTNRTVVVEAQECIAYPNFYCHTLNNLSPGKRYRFVVRARNKEVDTDGAPASVETVTKEGESTPPKNLKIINATENSVLLRWEIPDSINGQLRSFIIVTEQIDVKDISDEYNDDIPLQEYHVTSEERFYIYEITGLSTASTYSVAVAAKTAGVGEVARITVHTLPPKPNLPENALTLTEEGCGFECDTVSFQVHRAEHFNGLNRTYMLLLLSNSTRHEEPSDNTAVKALLRSQFGDYFHIVSEYTEEEMEEQPVITFDKGDLGIENEDLQLQQFALVLIQEYMGELTMDFSAAENK